MGIEIGTTTGIASQGGIDVNALYRNSLNGLNSLGRQLQIKMEKLANMDATANSSLYQTEMLTMQFYMGQYNAILEMVSSVSKSLTDMMKTLAQRTS